jgi:ABC-type polysaccharide/polyol phosphate transport system ATPase subunit
LNLRINPGEFVGIAGPIGTGKSFFLRGIMKERIIPKGKITTKGRIMYLPHDAWIVNATLQDNIILDQKFNQMK